MINRKGIIIFSIIAVVLLLSIFLRFDWNIGKAMYAPGASEQNPDEHDSLPEQGFEEGELPEMPRLIIAVETPKVDEGDNQPIAIIGECLHSYEEVVSDTKGTVNIRRNSPASG